MINVFLRLYPVQLSCQRVYEFTVKWQGVRYLTVLYLFLRNNNLQLQNIIFNSHLLFTLLFPCTECAQYLVK